MKKVLALTLAIVMLVLTLAACAPAASEKLVMGTNAAFPPYEFKEGETIVGIDADIAAALAEKLGMELEIKDIC